MGERILVWCQAKTRHAISNTTSKQDIKYYDKTITIANIISYFLRKYREAIEVQKHPNNLNRDAAMNGCNINKIWKTILLVIEDWPISPTSSLPQFSSFLLLALMKWTASFTKHWHSKNGSGHGRNPRNI